MDSETGKGSRPSKHAVFFLLFLFVLTLGIGIGSLLTYRAGGVARGDSQLKIQTEGKPLVGPEVTALSRAFSTVAKEVEPAVVNINTEELVRVSRRTPQQDDIMGEWLRRFFPEMPQQFRRQNLGSGVIVDPKGYIITNNHVVEGATKIKVGLAGGGDYPARIIATDALSDIAVIKIDGSKDFPYARIGDAKAMKVGDWVLAIGSPFGVEQTVTAGIISATGRVFSQIDDERFVGILFNDYLQTDAAINPGNSGGPLVNLNGEVIGINSFIQSRSGASAGVGFAVPSHIFVNVYNQILTKGKVSRGWIGVDMNALPNMPSLTPAMAKFFGVKQGGGVLITGLVAEDGTPSDTAGPAAKAGIRPEDVIVEFDGKPIYDVPDLRIAVANTPPGQKVKVKVVRHGEEKVFELTVAERTLEAAAQRQQRGALSFEEEEKPRTEIGLKFEDVPADVARQLNIKGGALITSVAPGSLAEDAGLQGQDRGGFDVIVAANGKKIESATEFLNVVRDLKSGESVVVKFLRVSAGQGRRLDARTFYTSFAKP
jgi:serine protease Do